MDIEQYISTGILELYVAGLLSEKENKEINEYSEKYPEIQKEIEEIEQAILELSKTASPSFNTTLHYQELHKKLATTNTKVVSMPKERTNYSSYLGWAAAIIFAAGFLFMFLQNESLQSTIQVSTDENKQLESQILEAESSLQQTKDLLNTIRDKNITVVALGGQEVAPESYAKAYWNKAEQKVFMDVRGLPEPPDGMVYQVWSLKLNPLTPTSLGTLDDFIEDDNKIFMLANANESEAFGITLEPAGGSESPTLEQLYTLGAVSS